MSPLILHILRSRWFTVTLHAGLWVLLYLAAVQLGGKAPSYQDSGSFTAPPQMVAPVGKVDAVFAAAAQPKPLTNAAANPFLTRYFVPPPTPAPPPPPTTRKIEVTYQGFYQTTNGPRFAVLKVAEGLMAVRIGGLVASNVYLASAGLTNVILTNQTAQTNILPLNAKKEIEVPIR